MKKNLAFLIAIMVVTGSLFAHQTGNTMLERTTKNSIVYSDSNSNTIFRSTQKMRSNTDGSEIYFYSNGNCEMYNSNGRRVLTCTYTYRVDEMFLLDEDGNIVYKGSCTVKNGELTYLNIAGQSYWKKK